MPVRHLDHGPPSDGVLHPLTKTQRQKGKPAACEEKQGVWVQQPGFSDSEAGGQPPAERFAFRWTYLGPIVPVYSLKTVRSQPLFMLSNQPSAFSQAFKFRSCKGHAILAGWFSPDTTLQVQNTNYLNNYLQMAVIIPSTS